MVLLQRRIPLSKLYHRALKTEACRIAPKISRIRQLRVDDKTGEKVFVTKIFKASSTGPSRFENEGANKGQYDLAENEDTFYEFWPRAAKRLKDRGLLVDCLRFQQLIAYGISLSVIWHFCYF